MNVKFHHIQNQIHQKECIVICIISSTKKKLCFSGQKANKSFYGRNAQVNLSFEAFMLTSILFMTALFINVTNFGICHVVLLRICNM